MALTSPLISAAELRAAIDRDDAPTILDVRWEIGPGARPDLYAAGHIPGAAFIDLDRDLSAPPGPGGRHPLPETADFTAAMRRAGVHSGRPVVLYDAANSLAAARGWWLLRHHGHCAAHVLDGGLSAWVAAGGPVQSGDETPVAGDFEGGAESMAVLDASGTAALARDGVLLDARAPERFRGDVEPMDRVGGHIPGARNVPLAANVEPTGHFRDPAALRAGFERAGVSDGSDVGAYCGSGITAAHAVLALELAGFSGALYPGSWSEWVGDPRRPVATGE